MHRTTAPFCYILKPPQFSRALHPNSAFLGYYLRKKENALQGRNIGRNDHAVKNKKAVEIEVNNRMVELREKNDHKGLVDYMETILDLNMVAGQLDPENAENNEHYFAYDKMLNLLAPMVFNDESMDLYVRVRAEIAKRAIDEHGRFINKSKELEKRVLNEEIEDAEYLKHDKKLLAKTGLALGFDGRRVYDLQCFDGMSRAALVAEGMADIDVRKEQLEMEKYCPEQTVSLKKMREECARRNEKIDTVEDYISSARRVKKALKFLQDDMSKDNNERGGGSGSYNNFVSTLDKLSKMDPETTKPREYIAQMNFALGAAETYVSKHQGFAHPFSARLPKGAERFDKAKLVRDILKLKIKEFESRSLTDCYFSEKNTKEELESLNAENDALRLSCKAKEQEIKELTAFRKAKEEFTELAANTWLKAKFDDTLAEHFAQHTEYTPEQIQNIKDTTSFEDYKNETKAQVLGNEQFKRFIDSIKDKQTLERMSSLAQGDGRGLYDSINTFAYNSNEKLSFLDEKIKAAQKSIDELSDNGRSINDQALKNDYAVIATAYYYKLAKKTGADEINDAAFNRKLEEIKGSKILSDMIVQDKGKTLYDQATADKGQNLWRNFFDRFEMQKKQGEIVKEHSASNTVIKEAGKGTLDLK